MNKAQLIGKYVKATIEGMDIETMEECLEYYITKEMTKDSYESILAEVKDYYPEILEAN